MSTLQGKLPDLKVTMLGELRIQSGTGVLTSAVNRSNKMWGLLCYLILNRHRSVPQEELLQIFWGQEELTNPLGALKTLLYRLRPLIKPIAPAGHSLILSRRGGYLWNPQVTCQVDLELYLRQCELARGAALADQEQMRLCRSAVALYKGRFLPELGRYSWIGEQAAACHQMYLEIVGALCAHLERNGLLEEMNEVCARAIEVDELQESFYVYQIKALQKMGRDTEALEYYQWAVELLGRKLGGQPTEALSALYTEIKKVEQGIENDLGEIQTNLRETAVQNGAFVCDYGFFREIYRLEVRRAARSTISIQLALLTVSLPFETEAEKERLGHVMEHLLDVLRCSLRNGDVISEYSPSQYVVMLPGAEAEDSNLIMGRVIAAYRRKYRYNCPKISCHIRKLEAGENLEF